MHSHTALNRSDPAKIPRILQCNKYSKIGTRIKEKKISNVNLNRKRNKAWTKRNKTNHSSACNTSTKQNENLFLLTKSLEFCLHDWYVQMHAQIKLMCFSKVLLWIVNIVQFQSPMWFSFFPRGLAIFFSSTSSCDLHVLCMLSVKKIDSRRENGIAIASEDGKKEFASEFLAK